LIVVNTPEPWLCWGRGGGGGISSKTGIPIHAGVSRYTLHHHHHHHHPSLPDVFTAPHLTEGCVCFISKMNTFSCAFLSRRILSYKPSDCENRNVSRNVSSLVHQPPDATANPTNFYWTYGFLITANPRHVLFPPDHFRCKQINYWMYRKNIYCCIFARLNCILKLKQGETR